MKILIYWHSAYEMPLWRRELLDRLVSMYPNAEVVHDIKRLDLDSVEHANRTIIADQERFRFCAGGPDRLHVDNDMEILKPLPLGELALMASEKFPHWSICWSGKHPEVFEKMVPYGNVKREYSAAMRAGIAGVIPGEYFTHWGADLDGNKCSRIY